MTKPIRDLDIVQSNLEQNGKLTKDLKMWKSGLLHDQLQRITQEVQKRRKEFLKSKNPVPEREYEQRLQEEAEILERTQKHAFNRKHARLMKQMFGFFYLTLFCNDLNLLVQTSSLYLSRTKIGR